MEGLDYLDSEEQLRRNLYGTQPIFGEVLPQEEEVNAGAVSFKGMGDFPDPKFIETVELNKRLSTDPKLLFLNDTSPHLSSYVRARVFHSFREGDLDVGKVIGPSLGSASTLGLPPLREEEATILNNRNRVGAKYR